MIRSGTEGPLGVLTLARPERRNALTPAMLDALASEIAALGSRCGCVLLEGEGPVFCAGFDLHVCRESPNGGAMRALLGGLDATIAALRECPAPTVAACQGGAIAGGCAIAAAADFTVADRAAQFGYPVTLLGVSPAVSAPTLGARIGSGPARSRMCDPTLIDGNAAWREGLVSDLVDSPDQVRGVARVLASALAAKPWAALQATKRWLNRLDGADTGRSESLAASLALAGGEEERALLTAFWSRRRSEGRGTRPE